MKYSGEVGITIRVDSAPRCCALVGDPILQQHNITLDIGRIKNPNKNPVVEHVIGELGVELLHINPEGGPTSPLILALSTANWTARIRKGGLLSREIWTQCDQITGEQLPLDDQQLIMDQHAAWLRNRPASTKSKVHGKACAPTIHVGIGDLVYLHYDKDKTRARNKYMITSITQDNCAMRKFTKKQFHLKEYNVAISECYPIQSCMPRHNQDPIRGMDSSDSESNAESTYDYPSS